MILVEENINDEGISISEIVEYNKKIEKDARDKFNELKSKNIILNSNFDENIWKITNQFKTVTFNFEFDELLYKAELKKRKMLKYQEFIDSVKSYCILRINNYIAETIANFIKKLKIFMGNTKYLNLKYIDERLKSIDTSPASSNLTRVIMIKDYLNFTEFPNGDIYREVLLEDIEDINDSYKNNKNNKNLNRRTLTVFQSIFMFDKLINEFWNNEATQEEKTYYYPIYLWWTITNILPIRATEFLLTPYDCIKKDTKGNYLISVRRSNLKGNGQMKYKKKVAYDIEKDYRICTYPISEKIAMNIKDYKEKTKSYNRKLLMSLEAYLNKDKDSINRYNNTFLLNDLNNLLLKFYVNILNNKKGIKIVDDNYLDNQFSNITNESILLDNEIKLIKAGDTRHFAMINMVLSDFNPILVKDFAGHTSINTSYHYFGNIAEVVKCISYNKYQELTQFNKENLIYENNNITSDKILVSMNKENEFTTEVDYGICLSKNFHNGNLNDCKVVGADCDVCNFFKRTIKESSEVRKIKLNRYEENIRREGKLLAQLLRRDTNNIKEIGECVLKIQSNATRYITKFNDGGYNNGE